MIQEFTRNVAARVADEYAGDPRGELAVWLQMALRREASVGEIYGIANLEQRLDRVQAPAAIVGLLRATIAHIWAQERAHAAYLEAVSMALAEPSRIWHRLRARLDGLLGAAEGHVLSGRTSPHNLPRAKAAILLAIGRRVQDVPAFVSTLSALSFRDFCNLNAELEITAVHGYERMLALLATAANASLADTTLLIDVQHMIRDERFHHQAFVTIAGWLDGDSVHPGAAPERCAERLAAIRVEVYGGG